MKPIQVGLLGLGTVGSGTIEVLRRNREEISRRAGRDIVIKVASARDLTKERKVSLEGIEIVPTAGHIVTRPDIDIVVELIGGDTAARERGCDYLALDSGTQRQQAHKFYFREGMTITSFHFDKKISGKATGIKFS